MNRSKVIGPSRWLRYARFAVTALTSARPAPLASERELSDPGDDLWVDAHDDHDRDRQGDRGHERLGDDERRAIVCGRIVEDHRPDRARVIEERDDRVDGGDDAERDRPTRTCVDN